MAYSTAYNCGVPRNCSAIDDKITFHMYSATVVCIVAVDVSVFHNQCILVCRALNSLNASVALGVGVFEAVRQRKA